MQCSASKMVSYSLFPIKLYKYSLPLRVQPTFITLGIFAYFGLKMMHILHIEMAFTSDIINDAFNLSLSAQTWYLNISLGIRMTFCIETKQQSAFNEFTLISEKPLKLVGEVSFKTIIWSWRVWILLFPILNLVPPGTDQSNIVMLPCWLHSNHQGSDLQLLSKWKSAFLVVNKPK